jgi:hypothetical protein
VPFSGLLPNRRYWFAVFPFLPVILFNAVTAQRAAAVPRPQQIKMYATASTSDSPAACRIVNVILHGQCDGRCVMSSRLGRRAERDGEGCDVNHKLVRPRL